MDGRGVGNGEDFPDSDHGEVLADYVVIAKGGDEVRKDVHVVGLLQETELIDGYFSI